MGRGLGVRALFGGWLVSRPDVAQLRRASFAKWWADTPPNAPASLLTIAPSWTRQRRPITFV